MCLSWNNYFVSLSTKTTLGPQSSLYEIHGNGLTKCVSITNKLSLGIVIIDYWINLISIPLNKCHFTISYYLLPLSFSVVLWSAFNHQFQVNFFPNKIKVINTSSMISETSDVMTNSCLDVYYNLEILHLICKKFCFSYPELITSCWRSCPFTIR